MYAAPPSAAAAASGGSHSILSHPDSLDATHTSPARICTVACLTRAPSAAACLELSFGSRFSSQDELGRAGRHHYAARSADSIAAEHSTPRLQLPDRGVRECRGRVRGVRGGEAAVGGARPPVGRACTLLARMSL